VEAFLALTQEKGFVQRRALHEETKTAELFDLLVPLVPNADPKELADSIGRNMIKPAMELAHRLQLAATIFTPAWTSYDGDLQFGHISSSTTDFTSFVSMSLNQSGKIIMPLSPAAAGGQQGSSVKYLFDIAPGLYSRSPDDEKAVVGKVISKPRVLVLVGTGVNTGPKNSSTLLKWIEDESKRESKLQREGSRTYLPVDGAQATSRSSMRSTFTSLNRKLKK
jgi:hypothetical protein